MNKLTKEAMKYKEILQDKEMELITKCRIIRYRIKDKITNKEIAEAFGMSRNTVSNIIKIFKTRLSKEEQEKILIGSLKYNEIMGILEKLKNKSRKPKWNKRQASKKQEELVLELFYEKGLRYGYKRFYKTLKRMLVRGSPNKYRELKNITYAQVRGIYKRNKLKVKKIRTKNGNVRSLYNYNKICNFEYLHADTKEILDQKALPEEIYNKFKNNKELPIYEWNVIDARTRIRFIAYSRERNSTFGFHYLLFVISFLRANKLVSPEVSIKLGVDNGAEFCGGSKKKEKEWNKYYKLLGARIYSYNPYFDIRKNIIERSHLSDDQEFYVPKAGNMKDRNSFIREANEYAYYWNVQRPHFGKGMDGKTPLEKLKQSNIVGAERILLFPTFILDRDMCKIRQVTDMIKFQVDLTHIKNLSQKSFFNLISQYDYSSFAQNVLTQYRKYL